MSFFRSPLQKIHFWEKYIFFPSRTELSATSLTSMSSLFSPTTICTVMSPKTSSRSPRVLPFRLLAAGDVPGCAPRFPARLPIPTSVFFLRAPFLHPLSHNVAFPFPPPRTLSTKERTFFCFLSREILDGDKRRLCGRLTSRQKERQTDRQTDRQRERERERERERDICISKKVVYNWRWI